MIRNKKFVKVTATYSPADEVREALKKRGLHDSRYLFRIFQRDAFVEEEVKRILREGTDRLVPKGRSVYDLKAIELSTCKILRGREINATDYIYAGKESELEDLIKDHGKNVADTTFVSVYSPQHLEHISTRPCCYLFKDTQRKKDTLVALVLLNTN